MKLKYIICLVVVSFYLSCSKDSNDTSVEEYLAENNIDAQMTPEGLYYVIDEPGGQVKPDINSAVTVHYKGFLTNGNVFDSSYDRGTPANFPLRNVIQGWQIGIPLFGKGGKGTLYIPPSLGYGSQKQSGIPKNSVLIFDVELININ